MSGWPEVVRISYYALFPKSFSLQSQQIASLTVGCLLAQGLVIGASRDLQRQKLRFPFAVPLSPFLLLCQGLCSGLGSWAAGPGLPWHWPEAARGPSLATRSWQLLPDVFWMLPVLPLQPAAAIWYIRDLKSE